MENIMKELYYNFEEKDNDIYLSIMISCVMMNKIIFNNHSDNEIILESIRLIIQAVNQDQEHCSTVNVARSQHSNFKNSEKKTLISRSKRRLIKPQLRQNGSHFQRDNNIIAQNPTNQINSRTQNYQAENLSLTKFHMKISSGVQVL